MGWWRVGSGEAYGTTSGWLMQDPIGEKSEKVVVVVVEGRGWERKQLK